MAQHTPNDTAREDIGPELTVTEEDSVSHETSSESFDGFLPLHAYDIIENILATEYSGTSEIEIYPTESPEGTATFYVYDEPWTHPYFNSTDRPEPDPIYIQKLDIPPGLIEAGFQSGKHVISLLGPTVTVEVAKHVVESIIKKWTTRRNEWKPDDRSYGGYSSTHGIDSPAGNY